MQLECCGHLKLSHEENLTLIGTLFPNAGINGPQYGYQWSQMGKP